ncbi:S-methyl-5-thioribose-1-phosphate isomerase [Turneriella parva]|uniref:Methylthioribose-1-phosphate isomerase n=1 Tax=Turneriella parva (strain ATCC BAA-1111 / DSM 21527 / NCTC 11395 / H) TaxID=869212 RepID=I4B6B1_TURPD|nr:S-methyl-5-thioribose-1-phosphate isomerase [Turneriella parva]AFM12818.1 Methylthioribose-1-phosphate isomerase [Turneriella parva DSM 21527]
MKTNLSFIKAARDKIQLLNQKLLPHKLDYVVCSNGADVAKAIKDMVVRGAPAIGISAAYGMYLTAWEASKKNKKLTLDLLKKQKQQLDAARPTAVNLMWATEQMLQVATPFFAGEPSKAKDAHLKLLLALYEKALEIHNDDAERCLKMSNNAVKYLLTKYPKEKYNILTHCNTGSLATGGIGTALGAIRVLHEKSKINMVYADETRPYLQGSRLTAFELLKDKIPVTLTVDSQAAYLMQKKMIDAVFVGADRIAANGDVANKIGTYSLSVLAKAHRIPFFVVAPKSTFDNKIENGDKIVVEERAAVEVLEIAGRVIAPKVPVVNYSFDVTPQVNITAIFSEDETLE